MVSTASADVKRNGSVDTVIEVSSEQIVRAADGETVVFTPVSTNLANDEQSKSSSPQLVGWIEIFRFSTRFDQMLMIVGLVAALCHGAVMPSITIFFGNIIDLFLGQSQCNHHSLNSSTEINNIRLLQVGTTGNDDSRQEIIRNIIALVIGGCLILVLAFLQHTTWSIAANNQILAIRRKFYKSLLRQDVGWFDAQSSGSLTTKFAEDISQIHYGIGDKVSLVFQHVGSCITGVAVGLSFGWQLSLAVLTLCPLIGFIAFVMVKLMIRFSTKEGESYGKAGGIAQEALGAIRTITAFGGQRQEAANYELALDQASGLGTKKGFYIGLMVGATFLVTIFSYGLGFTYGLDLANQPDSGYTISTIITCFFAILLGTSELGMSLTSFQQFTAARVAAYKIYEIIDRVPIIDSFSKQGKKIAQEFTGRIKFDSVHFAYPSRGDTPILQGINLDVAPGQTVALVGGSGCGKSTLIGLIQRLYDPTAGRILVEGHDLRECNIVDFRQLIGLVAQEPVLFSASIEENIRYGNKAATMEDIMAATRLTNVHDFIEKLPQGYQTQVGGQGGQISGGQKQRIAIARALVRNPRILLLDEATSALDLASERTVMHALHQTRHGRTTIIVAHRLSTVISADKIVVFDSGRIVETGTHTELMAKGGVYTRLFASQNSDNGSELDSLDSDQPVQAKQNELQSITHTANDAPSYNGSSEKEQPSGKPAFTVTRLFRLASPEWNFYLLGSFASVIAGAVWPVFAIIYTRYVNAFALCDPAERDAQGTLYSSLVFCVGGACFVSHLLQWSMFSIAGERLVKRIRVMAFESMMRQDVGWFDEDANSVGALTVQLSDKCAAVKDGTGPQFGAVIQYLVTIVSAVAIAFTYSWEIALIMLAFLPILAISRSSVHKNNSNKHIEQASKVLAETTMNMRTVMSLGNYRQFLKAFSAPLKERDREEIFQLIISGVLFAINPAGILFSYSAGLYAGIIFIEEGRIDFEQMFTAISVVLFSNFYAVGQASSTFPDLARSRQSAAELFALFDRKPVINWQDRDQNKVKPAECKGNPQFNNVQFCYPTRRTSPVLRNINLAVQSGKTIALVGPSGSGKSTVIQLLLRFYDANEGSVSMDEHDIKELNLPWLRSQISLVSQEPVLFDKTIAENIAYGVVDRQGRPTEAEIADVARQANAATFIEALPQGYDTRVGQKGAQLSGGQKQRIAIARALLRNPRILLLDEATSALDSKSEQLVQQALGRARIGRTTVIVAHRLSTVESADAIAVIKDGSVQELGTHAELMLLRGIYRNLRMAQD